MIDWSKKLNHRWLFGILTITQAGIIFYLSQRDWSATKTKITGNFSNLLHLPLFGALAAFFALALGAASSARASRSYWWAILGTGLYGLSDEIHQNYRPQRHPSVVDLIVDVHGAALACFLLSLLLDQDRRFRDRVLSAVLILLGAVGWCFFGSQFFPDADQTLRYLLAG